MKIFRSQPSYLLLMFSVLLHCLAAKTLYLAAELQPWCYLTLPLLCFSVVYNWRYAQLRLANSVTQLGMLPDKQWFIVTHHNKLLAADISGNSIVTRYLMLIYLNTKHSKQSLLFFVLPDSLSAASRRQLRLALAYPAKKT